MYGSRRVHWWAVVCFGAHSIGRLLEQNGGARHKIHTPSGVQDTHTHAAIGAKIMRKMEILLDCGMCARNSVRATNNCAHSQHELYKPNCIAMLAMKTLSFSLAVAWLRFARAALPLLRYCSIDYAFSLGGAQTRTHFSSKPREHTHFPLELYMHQECACKMQMTDVPRKVKFMGRQ